MANQAQDIISPRQYRLIRKKRFLEKVPFSKSMLALRLNPDSPYFDETLPQPIYFPGSRIPYFDETAVDAWISSHAPSAKPTLPAIEVSSTISTPTSVSPSHSGRKTITIRAKLRSDGVERLMTVELRKPRHHQAISHSTAN